MNLLYLIGAPGAGKSSTMAALTAGLDRVPADRPVKHDRLIRPATGEHVGTELGRWRHGFPGTDTLPLNAAPAAAAWVATHPARLLLAEGDRLAHMGFLHAAAHAGYRVTVCHLTAPADLLDARCAERGSRQNEAWRKGRATKAANLAEAVPGWHRLVTVDTAAQPAEAVAATIRAQCPFLEEVAPA